MRRNQEGKKNRRTSILAGIFCVLAALAVFSFLASSSSWHFFSSQASLLSFFQNLGSSIQGIFDFQDSKDNNSLAGIKPHTQTAKKENQKILGKPQSIQSISKEEKPRVSKANTNTQNAVAKNANAPAAAAATKLLSSTPSIAYLPQQTLIKNTKTVVIDKETKKKVDKILTFLGNLNPDRTISSSSSDRGGFSIVSALTATFDDLSSNTLGVGSNHDHDKVTINGEGDITAAGDLTVSGNLAVSGSQTYSGAAEFSATSTVPALVINQSGTGYALQAGNVTAKGGTISTATGDLVLDSATRLIDVAADGIHLAGGIPGSTSMALYSDGGTLKWNGAALALGSSVSGAAGYIPKFISSSDLGNSTIYETSGNVGIGTTGPVGILHVDGGIAGDAENGTSISLYAQDGGSGDTNGGNIFLMPGESSGSGLKGWVGIGTTSATEGRSVSTALEVAGTITISGNGVLNMYRTTANNSSNGLNVYKRGRTGDINGSLMNGGEIGYHNFYGWDGAAYGRGAYAIAKATEDWTAAGHGTSYQIATTPNGSTGTTVKMFVGNDGNVGIGTITPASLLDVRSSSGGIITASRNDTSITAGDVLGVLQFRAADSSTVTNNIAASISAIAKSTIATDINPGILAFSTTPSDVAGLPTERMRIDEAGNVGIGTTAPTRKLQIDGGNSSGEVVPILLQNSRSGSGSVALGFTVTGDPSATVSGKIGMQRTDLSASGDADLYFNTYYNSASRERIRILSTGNVGIGTTGPGAKLDVSGAFATNPILTLQASDGAATDRYFVKGISDSDGNGAGTATEFWIDGAGGAVFTGNVGIGTTGPLYLFDVNGTIGIKSGSPLVWGYNSTAKIVGTEGASSYLAMFTAGANERVRVDSSGNVGIGTTGPAQKLHIGSATDAFALVESTGAGSNAGFSIRTAAGRTGQVDFWQDGTRQWLFGTDGSTSNFVLQRWSGSAWGSKLAIDTTGNVGIGTTAPDSRLHVLSTNAGATTNAFAIGNGSTDNNTGANLLFNLSTNLNSYTAAITAVRTNSPSTGGTYLGFSTHNGMAVGERVRISESGNVGIGTTVPGVALDVVGTIRGSGNVYAGGSAAVMNSSGMVVTNASGINIGNSSATGDLKLYAGATEWMRVLSTGNVGIGTTAPGSKLHIYSGASGATARTGTVFTVENLGTAYLSWLNPAANTGGFLFATENGDRRGGVTYKDNVADGMIFYSGGSEQMRILNSGNVGIGTTSPGFPLDVVGSSGFIAARFKSAYSFKAVIGTDNSSEWFGNDDGINGITDAYVASGAHFLAMRSNGAERLRLDSSGNVGIGTTAPGYTLDVNGGFRVGNATSTSAIVFNPTSGNVGIGTTSPSQKLDVNGKIMVGDLTTAGGADAVYSVGGVLTTVVSSNRFKENINNYEDVLSSLNQLRPVRFTWKDNTATPGKEDFGFIAEEAAVLFPELVTYEEDGTTIRGFKYDKLPILLTKAVQEQQKEIDVLNLVLGPQGMLGSDTPDSKDAQGSGLFDWLVRSLDSLGLALKDGVASLKEVAAKAVTSDLITSKKSITGQMCVKDSNGGDICLTGDQLKDLIERTGSSVTVNQTFTQPAATTTPEIVP